MSDRDDELGNDGQFDENGDPIEASLTDEERAELGPEHPLADLSPFADGFEGTNIDEDSDFELEDTEYLSDANNVFEELLARVGEQAPQPRLEATRRAVELIGDPQRTYPVIHITGTNGKTSTSRIIESILRAYGLRTGLMTSPHLVRVNERIVIDGRAISNRALAENWADIRPFLLMVDAELMAKGEEALTYFEALTVLAFASFADAPIDVAILEVGMGGEWDSTNVADGQVAVFTPIALDHTHRLGTTIAQIARTKAGIIKPAAAIVSAIQSSDAQIELERAADLTESTIGVEGDAFELLSSNVAVGGQLISVRGLAGTYSDLFMPLFGEFQGHNAALAIAAVESFLGAGSQALVHDVLAEGLATVASPGRLQVIGAEPTVIVDAAHNPHGAAALAVALKEYFTFEDIAFVIAVVDDKDAAGIVEALAPIANRFYVTASQSDRAVPPEELVETVRAFTDETTDFDSFAEAMELARSWAAENERRAVVVTGSITLVGEALALAEAEGWKP
ncbi:bifunctional folylpolyglutamate synthase/dihydrofolate synthase [Salinibacterium sp. NSLL150]|uniref:bifunctional folylpolyglutamate synthase/dihydrofolate synthase n=1 Tax=unclassified Salinibacterium TaxID=2632331 RepID=UPI0018CFE7F5|nr:MULTISPECIES: folylpolyglutamate synthase/dihydrofolate synthase family protein [unclassified Salinibacterium]MBH0098852.1 bifunctional folylpolyglutamate synthase/dihydrofolate synthase [Salinibacterium sp. NSLL35]MBH0101607.1 bifunctional folylpolyglutamate synthase/dihydrofolate synthase [Salinibacterium sp. NSLL150]MBH0104366.1 bifunctional folylpolyglutamate synthase/dihydrofolate synthase [Salinibacterium sp. NSLL16]MBH0107127.1 bifunctional folylpolyglutamate synthase/dihydrofolate sy